MELSKYKIRVNGLKLGAIKTGAFELAGLSKEEADKVWDTLTPCHPIGRLGKFDDVSEMVKFLANRKTSGWITGANMELNGGWGLIGAGNSFNMSKM